MINEIDSLSGDRYNSVIIQNSGRSEIIRKNILKDSGDTLSREQIKEMMQKEKPEIDPEAILKSLDEFNSIDLLNKKVRLYMNKDINRIIISIVDKNTGEIIKEIPCEELQNLALHLRETIGMLYDEKV